MLKKAYVAAVEEFAIWRITGTLNRYGYNTENGRKTAVYIRSLERQGYTLNYDFNVATKGNHSLIGFAFGTKPLSPDFRTPGQP